MGGLSLKFNVNERPTMRLLCCLYAHKAHFPSFLWGFGSYFWQYGSEVISLLGVYFEM